MKFLTDENIALSVLKALRKQGHNIKDVKEEKLQGAADKELLRIALAEECIILTHDKDFANLITQKKVNVPGVILLRFRNQNSKFIIPTLLSVLQSNLHEKFSGNLVIISENNVVIEKLK